jgi:hypothetical protein
MSKAEMAADCGDDHQWRWAKEIRAGLQREITLLLDSAEKCLVISMESFLAELRGFAEGYIAGRAEGFCQAVEIRISFPDGDATEIKLPESDKEERAAFSAYDADCDWNQGYPYSEIAEMYAFAEGFAIGRAAAFWQGCAVCFPQGKRVSDAR